MRFGRIIGFLRFFFLDGHDLCEGLAVVSTLKFYWILSTYHAVKLGCIAIRRPPPLLSLPIRVGGPAPRDRNRLQ